MFRELPQMRDTAAVPQISQNAGNGLFFPFSGDLGGELSRNFAVSFVLQDDEASIELEIITYLILIHLLILIIFK